MHLEPPVRSSVGNELSLTLGVLNLKRTKTTSSLFLEESKQIGMSISLMDTVPQEKRFVSEV